MTPYEYPPNYDAIKYWVQGRASVNTAVERAQIAMEIIAKSPQKTEKLLKGYIGIVVYSFVFGMGIGILVGFLIAR